MWQRLNSFIRQIYSKKDNLRIKDKEIESLPQTQTLQPEGGIIVFLPVWSVSFTVQLLKMIYYSLGQNLLIILKYTVLSQFSSRPIQLVKD